MSVEPKVIKGKISVPLRKGQLFKDGNGVIWVALNNLNSTRPSQAILVWHPPGATPRIQEDEFFPERISTLPQPFTLILDLDKEEL